MTLLDYMEKRLGEVLDSPEMYAISSDALEAEVWVLSDLLAFGYGLSSPKKEYAEFWAKEMGESFCLTPCWSNIPVKSLADILRKWVSQESKRRSERPLENS